MQLRRLPLGCCLLWLCVPLSTPAADPKPPPELRWAKRIALDFWEAILTGEKETAAGLVSPELFKGTEQSFPRSVDHPARNYDMSALSFTSEELAPDSSEAIFKGRLAKEGIVSYDFTLRVAKEGGNGKWSIRYFRLTMGPVTESKGRKGPPGDK